MWVITGDKQETAINIGYSCRLLKKGMTVLTINAKDDQDCNEKLRALVASYCDKVLSPTCCAAAAAATGLAHRLAVLLLLLLLLLGSLIISLTLP